MVLSVVGLRVDWARCDVSRRRSQREGQIHLQPGISMASASASDEEKHSTSAISESEEATNAPRAAKGVVR